ncbi:cysteine desulfurase [Seinonella peptonophila]|uniref:cysteine desulfurase n=1 Tax=Seinonella peptonophila TaxID=112248 RepID=A0A1M4WA93_9BACL|nr:cysteine desulfurase family protein [Seinonella peptonophila]SHE78191.1 cysteine desulfurase [Seinonella peptonophila]
MFIYLDHAATTPLHPEVKQAMLPYFDQQFGNPSSLHQFGREARAGIEQSRRLVAEALQVKPQQIIFTSGGTEADNLAIIGMAQAQAAIGKKHIITSTIEHHAVLDACHHLEKIGFKVTYIPVDHTGKVDPFHIEQAITSDTALISIMWANNETGVLQPIAEIGQIASQHQIPFHSDAVQAIGMVELDLASMHVDLLTISAHKINGPKGVGALYLKDNLNWSPRQFGGTQERRRRPGTENVSGIVGFGKAIELASQFRADHIKQMSRLRDAFLDQLEVPYEVNGDLNQSLSHILNLSFPGMQTEVMLMNLDLAGIACASGSACTSGTLEVSHVLKAMKLDEERIQTAIRFSFGWGTTQEQLLITAKEISKIYQRLITNVC